MSGLRILAELARMRREEREAALAGPLAEFARVSREIAALETLGKTGFDGLATGGAGLDGAWQHWRRQRMLTLRREQALARAVLEERRADLARALAESEVTAAAAASERAARDKTRQARADDALDLLTALRGRTR